MRTVVVALLLVLSCASNLHAEGVEVGSAAPALPEAVWILPPEPPTLAAAAGRVLLVGFWPDTDAARADPWLDVWQETHWKKGLRVLVLARIEPEPLRTLVSQRAFAYPIGSVAGLGAYTAAARAGETVLVDADGQVAWRGRLEGLDGTLLAKLLRRVKLPDEELSPAAGQRLADLAERSVEVGAPGLAVDVYDHMERRFRGTPADGEFAKRAKELKRDERSKASLAASKAFFPIVTAWMRTGASEGKQKHLAKRIDRFLKRHGDTRSGAQARLLLAGLRGDAALAAIRDFIREQGIDTSGGSWRTRLPKPPKLEFTPGRRYVWLLETSEGPLRLRLFPDVAPLHVSSTIYLTELGFYDGLRFHRVIPGFMAQAGCPRGNGTGNPGYGYEGEFDASVRHDRPGLLSMANAGAGTDGSQFFITFGAARHLDGKHTIFGELIDGRGTLKKLEALGTPGAGSPKKPVVIEKATIEVE